MASHFVTSNWTMLLQNKGNPWRRVWDKFFRSMKMRRKLA